eukprot:5978749-Alexandrium_andersonii.AAC.1
MRSVREHRIQGRRRSGGGLPRLKATKGSENLASVASVGGSGSLPNDFQPVGFLVSPEGG